MPHSGSLQLGSYKGTVCQALKTLFKSSTLRQTLFKSLICREAILWFLGTGLVQRGALCAGSPLPHPCSQHLACSLLHPHCCECNKTALPLAAALPFLLPCHVGLQTSRSPSPCLFLRPNSLSGCAGSKPLSPPPGLGLLNSLPAAAARAERTGPDARRQDRAQTASK